MSRSGFLSLALALPALSTCHATRELVSTGRAGGPGLGTNHGSPRRFDRSVPLYLRAPGRVRAGTLVAEPLRFDAFTRTLASLLGLPRDAIAPTSRDLCRR